MGRAVVLDLKMVAIRRWCLLLRLALVTVGSAFGISLLPKLVNDTGNGHRLPGRGHG